MAGSYAFLSFLLAFLTFLLAFLSHFPSHFSQVEPEEVVQRLNRKPVLLRDGETGELHKHQLKVGYAPSLSGKRGFRQLCDDCRRRQGLGKVAVVVVSCESLDGRHAVAAFEVAGEMFKTVLAENSLGDAFYVTEHNYVRHLLLDVTIAQTFDEDGAASDWSPPELLSYRETVSRNTWRWEEEMKGLGAGGALRQKNLALKEQREARAAAAQARRAVRQREGVESAIARRQKVLRDVIGSTGMQASLLTALTLPHHHAPVPGLSPQGMR